MLSRLLACLLVLVMALTGCRKEAPREVKSIRKLENLKPVAKEP